MVVRELEEPRRSSHVDADEVRHRGSTPPPTARGRVLLVAVPALLAWGALAWAVLELSRGTRGIAYRTPLVVALTALGLFGLLSAHGGEERGVVPRLRRGAERLWPSLALAATLPLTRLLPAAHLDARVAALALVATLVAARSEARTVTRSREWPLVTLALALFAVVVYLAVGARLSGSTDNDAAYYFGVARHMARTLRYEEPIVWHFLRRTKSVVHLPFDYWHGTVSLFLVPFLRAFGSGFRVVGTTMALVSSASVLAFWYLVSMAAPIRSAWIQVTSLLLFAFSPALLAYRFDAETIPFVHVWLILALVAIARGFFAWAVSFAFSMFWSRADTLGLFVVILAFASLSAAGRDRREGLRVLAVAAGWAALYMGFHLVVFRTVAPPAARVAPLLVDGLELYRWHDGPLARVSLERILAPDYLDGRVIVAVDAFGRAGFFTHTLPWLGLGAAAGLRPQRGRRGVDVLVRLLVLIGAFLVSWSTTPVFAFWRTLHSLLPALVLAGAYGAEAWTEQLLPTARGSRHASGKDLGARALACVVACVMLHTLRPYVDPPRPSSAPADVTAALPFLREGPVMALLPWFVLAYTDHPAVGIPENGEAAMAAAISAYGVRSLVLVGDDPCPDGSAKVCREIVSGKRTRLGSHRLTKAGSRGAVAVFRIAGG